MTADAELLGRVYELVSEAVRDRTAAEMLRPTRAAAWTVQDLLFHLMLDAQRALLAFATPAQEAADVDATTYWASFGPDEGDGGAAHARFVRVCASAYGRPEQLVQHWSDTAGAAVRAAAAAPPDGRVRTQGHVLTVGDFVDTLVVEAAVHYLDLTLELSAPAPPPETLALTRTVLDGLLGETPAVGWTDTEHVLKGTGRLRLTESDRAALGGLADRFPLLG